jgi:hypothetical protein
VEQALTGEYKTPSVLYKSAPLLVGLLFLENNRAVVTGVHGGSIAGVVVP